MRLLVYDATGRDALSLAWRSGAMLYRGIGAIDVAHGAHSWADALAWIATVRPGVPIHEIQYWGHGKWGGALIGDEFLDESATRAGHPLHDALRAVRTRLVGPEALWWWRTCETFGAEAGHAFARTWTRFLGCRSAGHTYIIAAWQSGLHALRAGDEPTWSTSEGLAEGTPAAPVTALWSARRAPSTIHFMTTKLPRDR